MHLIRARLLRRVLVAPVRFCGLSALAGGRQVPTLRVRLVNGLAVGVEVAGHARGSQGRALQQPAVQAALSLGPRDQGPAVERVVADPELVVTAVVSGDPHAELDRVPSGVGALHGRGMQVRLVPPIRFHRNVLHRVAAEPVRLGRVLRGPDAAAAGSHGRGAAGLQAVGAVLLALAVRHDVARRRLGEERVAPDERQGQQGREGEKGRCSRST
mmetsp:Transcript_31746/g.91104  ORF Transcript_31746/g.91104 Transcript_31746/m.91104 type:complete len:214 (+) Transcript_31746:1275-1916(+)